MNIVFLGLTFVAHMGIVSLYSINERLISAITSNDSDQVRDTLKEYSDRSCLENDLNTPHILYETPLQCAVGQGHLDIVKQLLDAGANPNVPSFGGHIYPLASAAFDGNLPVVQELCYAGANPNACDTSRASVLAHAVYGSGRKIVAFLLGHGADPKLRDNQGWSPLMHAVRGGQIEALAELLEDERNTVWEDYPYLKDILSQTGTAALMAEQLLDHGLSYSKLRDFSNIL